MSTGGAEAATGSASMHDLVVRAEAEFRAAGVPSPRHDAELLMAHVLDVERSGVARLILMQAHIDGEQRAAFVELAARRSRREPVQHLTGRAPFRHIELRVGPGVFVPRPETELVAGAVIDALHGHHEPAIVVDLCSGSGAIALAVADEVPHARVYAIELGDDAVVWLRRNVEAQAAHARVSVLHGDAAEACDVVPELVGSCDVVVSNPPYVPDAAEIRDPEVIHYDPALALWGGTDGLDLVRRIERQAATLLRPGGLLVVEHADLQGESLPELLTSAPAVHRGTAAATTPWRDVVDHRDLAGRPRFTTARRAVDVVA